MDIRIDSNSKGVEINWSHPSNSLAKIDYYQIYYRQVINPNISNQQTTNTWKTTESIEPDRTHYFIDKSGLPTNANNNNNQEESIINYELKMISFGAFSKSLPTNLYKFTFRCQPEPPQQDVTQKHNIRFTNFNTFIPVYAGQGDIAHSFEKNSEDNKYG